MTLSLVVLLCICGWAVLSIVATYAFAKLADTRERVETPTDRR